MSTLRFSCRNCARVFNAQIKNAGKKFDCSCGQRLQIPAPPNSPLNKTVVGKVVDGLAPAVQPIQPAKNQPSHSELNPSDSGPSDVQVKKVAVIITLSVSCLITIGVCSGAGTWLQSPQPPNILPLAIVLVVTILSIISAWSGQSNECPKCRWWWVKTFDKKTVTVHRILGKRRAAAGGEIL